MASTLQQREDFLTVDEAAALVGLSHWTIRKMLQAGRLTKYKSQSRTVVNVPELEALLRPQPVLRAEAAK